MKLHIKNMVCDRCVAAVTTALTSLGFDNARVGMGYAEIATDPTAADIRHIGDTLKNLGFELLNNPDDALVEQAKIAIIGYARDNNRPPIKLSAYLSECLGIDYQVISRLFSSREGRTLENYLISQRIEYVKELLDYGELSVSEIAYRSGYSSVAHLSRQFKQVTGMTAGEYRSNGSRRALDKV